MATLIELFTAVSLSTGLPPGLLESVCWVETKHQPTAIHQDDGGTPSLGLCQVKKRTCDWLGIKGDLMKPKVNALCAARYLSYQITRYNSVDRALVAYNRGNSKGLTRSTYSDKVNAKWRSL